MRLYLEGGYRELAQFVKWSQIIFLQRVVNRCPAKVITHVRHISTEEKLNQLVLVSEPATDGNKILLQRHHRVELCLRVRLTHFRFFLRFDQRLQLFEFVYIVLWQLRHIVSVIEANFKNFNYLSLFLDEDSIFLLVNDQISLPVDSEVELVFYDNSLMEDIDYDEALLS